MSTKSTFDNVWSKLGGRKLIAFFLGLVVLVALALTDTLTDNALWGILGLAASFSGGNVGEHLSKAITERARASVTPPADPEGS